MRNFDKKIFNLPTFMFLWSLTLHVWQIHWVFCLIFAGIKTKTSQSSLYSTAFFKILKEPALVQKPTIPHMKALILSYLEPEGWGRGITMGAPRPPPVKLLATFYYFWNNPIYPLLSTFSSLFQDSEETSRSTLTNDTSYQMSTSHEYADIVFMT